MREIGQGQREQTVPEGQQSLPLVVEYLPGQAIEGPRALFEPGTWESKTSSILTKEGLEQLTPENVEVEFRDSLKKVRDALLHNGKFLNGGRQLDENPLKFAVVGRTQSQQPFYHIRVNIIDPQEGGYLSQIC